MGLNLDPRYLGNWSGNGGGDQTSENIWFLGDEPVEYCLFRANGYPLSDEELSDLVRQSIDQWLKFFKDWRLDRKNFAQG